MEQEARPQDRGEMMYTTEEVAQRLRVTPKTVREWIGRGELAAWDAGQGYQHGSKSSATSLIMAARPSRQSDTQPVSAAGTRLESSFFICKEHQ